MAYLLPYLILGLAWWGDETGGLFTWTGALLIFGVLTLLEFFFKTVIRPVGDSDRVWDLILFSPFPFFWPLFCAVRSSSRRNEALRPVGA
jgi:membrane protein DedA with SNARE-associated domain